MNQPGGLFRPLLSDGLRPSPLAGGQAPAGWQREMARRTARLDILQRACAWVWGLVAVRTKLRDEPLLGHCLAALANQPFRSTGTQPEALRPQPPEFTWPTRPSERDRGMAPTDDQSVTPSQSVPLGVPITAKRAPQAAGEQSSRGPAPIPFSVQRQASRAHLSRMAGESVPAEGSSRTRRRPVVAALAPKASTSPTVPRDPASHREWLYELARRAERSLRQGKSNAPGTPQRAASDQSEPGQVSSLAAQWALPLTRQPASAHLLSRPASVHGADNEAPSRKAQPGPAPRRTPTGWSPDSSGKLSTGDAQLWQAEGLTAPSDLLSHLTSAPVGNKRFGRKAQPGASPRRTSATQPPDSSGTPGVEDVRTGQLGGLTASSGLLTRLASEPGGDRGSGQAAPLRPKPPHASATWSPGLPDTLGIENAQPWPTEDTPALAASVSASRRGGITGEPDLSTRTVPPVAAPSLPPHLLSQEVGEPSPSVAATIVRQDARQEEMAAAGDDLSELAAKIKRILIEEGRRHGMDVS